MLKFPLIYSTSFCLLRVMLVYYRGQDSFSGVGSVLPQYGPQVSISGCPAEQQVPLLTKPLCRSFFGIFKEIHMVIVTSLYLSPELLSSLWNWSSGNMVKDPCYPSRDPGSVCSTNIWQFTTPTTGDLVPSAGLLSLKKNTRESEPIKQ